MRVCRGKPAHYVAWLQCSLVVSAIFLAQVVSAKDEEKRDRIRFYGVVETMPQDFHGNWVIGGNVVTTGPRTQFDQQEGPLRVGGCAKVDIRAGLVHEIDSEPAWSCR